MSRQNTPVIILGAGPAGLSIAHELLRRGLPCLVLEKGTQAGESFAHYPKHIWFGPWLNNTLPGSQVGWSWLLRRATQPAYTWYLREYARHKSLPIRFGTVVSRVRREGSHFLLDTSTGPLICDILVNATGYYSKPYVPKIPGLEGSHVPDLHSAAYREAADLSRTLGPKDGKRVLVVGQGLSAGETMCELAREGFSVGLSIRGPLRLGPSSTVETLLSPFAWVREQLAVRLRWRLPSNPPMAGGKSRRLLDSGTVAIYPSISSVKGDSVVFADGRREHFDAMVFCTGYQYAQDHLVDLIGSGVPELKDGVESVRAPGLFFLGLDQQRSFRSRFLRGIRSDAQYLATVLAPRVKAAEMAAPLPAAETGVVDDFVVDLDKSPEAALLGQRG